MNWLEKLNYLYRCDCGSQTITNKDPICECGGQMSLIRCVDKLGYVRSDSLNDVRNPVDGKTYDSKSSYYKAVEGAGCNIVEDNPLERKFVDRANYDNSKDIHEAIMQVTKGQGL